MESYGGVQGCGGGGEGLRREHKVKTKPSCPMDMAMNYR